MFSGILTPQILQCHQTCTVGLWPCFAATDVLEGHISSGIIKQECEGSLNLSMAKKQNKTTTHEFACAAKEVHYIMEADLTEARDAIWFVLPVD